jgi:hypothetical protein
LHAPRAQGGVIKKSADYKAIASSAPFLTHLSLALPATSKALRREMSGLLSACSKLEDLALSAIGNSKLADITVLAVGTQLVRLKLPTWCPLSNLAPLAALANLQSLDISRCAFVSDLAPLRAMLNLQSLNMSSCTAVSDLAPLAALVKLQSLAMTNVEVSDLAPLAALVKLQSLIISGGLGRISAADLPNLQHRIDDGELEVTGWK